MADSIKAPRSPEPLSFLTLVTEEPCLLPFPLCLKLKPAFQAPFLLRDRTPFCVAILNKPTYSILHTNYLNPSSTSALGLMVRTSSLHFTREA
jgi:hypothetical protein